MKIDQPHITRRMSCTLRIFQVFQLLRLLRAVCRLPRVVFNGWDLTPFHDSSSCHQNLRQFPGQFPYDIRDRSANIQCRPFYLFMLCFCGMTLLAAQRTCICSTVLRPIVLGHSRHTQCHWASHIRCRLQSDAFEEVNLVRAQQRIHYIACSGS